MKEKTKRGRKPLIKGEKGARRKQDGTATPVGSSGKHLPMLSNSDDLSDSNDYETAQGITEGNLGLTSWAYTGGVLDRSMESEGELDRELDEILDDLDREQRHA